MCRHSYVKINDVYVCRKCGLTITFDGKIIFDKRFPNYNAKKRRKSK